MRNIWAFTEPTAKPVGYPGYISINYEPNGHVSIAVRSDTSEDGNPSQITLTPEQCWDLGFALIQVAE